LIRQLCAAACTLTAVLLSACSAPPQPTPTATPMPTPTPSLADAETVGRDYLRAWQEGAYVKMYSALSPAARAEISADRFVGRHQAIADEAGIVNLTAGISQTQRVLTDTAQIAFNLTIDTHLVGQIRSENSLLLSFDGRQWLIDWTPEAIFPLLVHDNLVHMFIERPQRGAIYDRNGQPLALEEQLFELGVVPGQIKDEPLLLSTLSKLLTLSEEAIRSRYSSAARPDWFMPIATLRQSEWQKYEPELAQIDGITWRTKSQRAYPAGDTASHTIGHMAAVDAEALELLKPQGYEENDVIGVVGLEGWGEQYLAGQRGATLAIISPEGRIVWTLGSRPKQAGYHIETTLDLQLQQATEQILGTQVGSIVVQGVDSGRLLAMVSYPGYDPATFVNGTDLERQELLSRPQQPFLNRSVAGLYPPGSTFKIIPFSAAIEVLGLTRHSSYFCAGAWEGLGTGTPRYCWLKTGHGTLDLFNGLVQSCDTVFWEVGSALNAHDPNVLPRYARAFGLGAPTGLQGLPEAAGLIPDPTWKAANYSGAEQQWLLRDAANMAIGQGDVLATPLQMVNLVSAVANGGTLRTPGLIERLIPIEDANTVQLPSPVTSQLPVQASTLQLLRETMEGVVTYGTASRAFVGARIPMAGKSGTAEAPPNETHAWFVGYAPADNPRIAVAVVLEHGGEGGARAAPLFRQVVEAYMAMYKDG